MPSTTCRCGAVIEFRVLSGERAVPAQRVRGAYLAPKGNPQNRPTEKLAASTTCWLYIDHRDVCPWGRRES